MTNVLKFPTKHTPPANASTDSAFFAGLAAGYCDCYRNGGEYAAELALRESGLHLEDFRDAGVEDYDLETLEEIYRSIE